MTNNERGTDQSAGKRIPELDVACVGLVKMLETRVGASVILHDEGLVVGETVGLVAGVATLLVRVGTGVIANWEGWAVGSVTAMPVGVSVGPGVGKLVGVFVQ